jgi:hypothetical protein
MNDDKPLLKEKHQRKCSEEKRTINNQPIANKT